MRILIIKAGIAHKERELQYNGQEIGICNALKCKGYEAQVVYFTSTIPEAKKSNYNDEITYVPCKRLGNQAWVDVNELKAFPCDAVFIMADNKLFVNHIINYYIKVKKIHPICYFGVLFTNSNSIVKKALSRFILELNRSAFAKTLNFAKTLAAKEELERYHLKVNEIMPVGLDETKLYTEKIDDKRIRIELGFDESDKIILFVGRFVPEKKASFFIKLVDIMAESNATVKAIVIGNGPEQPAVEEALNNCRHKEKITMLKSVDYSEMYKYYSVANCFVNLSKIEIFGMAILESMYYGCPVVAHNAPGPNTIIENGKTGILLSGYDMGKWIEKIQYAISNTDMIVSAMSSVKDKFIWNQTIAAIEKYL